MPPPARPSAAELAACVRPDGADALLRVRATPRAHRSVLGEVVGDALRVRLAAPPVEGKANAALVALLAELLALRAADLELATGARGRVKTVRVHGLGADEVARRLGSR